MSTYQQKQAAKILESYKDSQEVIKGGVGSRGGKVVGYTKSGKPIYSSGYHSDYNNNSKYSKEDRSEISEYHKKTAAKLRSHYGKETTAEKEHTEWGAYHGDHSK